MTPRVQPVGHEHFGIVGINCAQAGSNLFLCDFYGRAGEGPTLARRVSKTIMVASAKVPA